jgi:hypothetical protein
LARRGRVARKEMNRPYRHSGQIGWFRPGAASWTTPGRHWTEFRFFLEGRSTPYAVCLSDLAATCYILRVARVEAFSRGGRRSQMSMPHS